MNYFQQLHKLNIIVKDNLDKIALICGFVFVLLFHKFFPNKQLCIFKNLFHIPCPGCGLTRAFYSILHGDFCSAFYYNALSIPLSFFVLISFFWNTIDYINKRDSYSKFMNKLKSPKFIGILVLITILNWIWDIIKGI